MNLTRLKRQNIADETYDILKANIINHVFTPGERLDLREIERALGISKTPLKAALNRLLVEGLIEIVPGKGTFITSPTAQELAESFDVRCVLETYAMELAVPRMEESHLDRIRTMVRDLREMVDSGHWDDVYQQYVNLDHALHRFIVELTGNKQLLRVYDQLNVHSQMARIRYMRAEEELDVAQEEHEEILRYLEAGDIRGTLETVNRHIQRAKESLLRDMNLTHQS